MKKLISKKAMLPYMGCIIALIAVVAIAKISEDIGFYLYVVAVVVILVGVIRMVSKPISKDK